MQADRPELGYYINNCTISHFPSDKYLTLLGLQSTEGVRADDADRTYNANFNKESAPNIGEVQVDIAYGVPIVGRLIEFQRFQQVRQVFSIVQRFDNPDTFLVARFNPTRSPFYNWHAEDAARIQPTPDQRPALERLVGDQVDLYSIEERRYGREKDAVLKTARAKIGIHSPEDDDAHIVNFMTQRVGDGFKSYEHGWIQFNNAELDAYIEAMEDVDKRINENLGQPLPEPILIKVEELDDFFANIPLTTPK